MLLNKENAIGGGDAVPSFPCRFSHLVIQNVVGHSIIYSTQL